mgnify:FL=1
MEERGHLDDRNNGLLEVSWGVTQPKWHPLLVEQPVLGDEHGIGLTFRLNWNVVKAGF